MAIFFNSTTATMAMVDAAMVSAINGAGFGCTAQVQPDGTIALYGTGVTLDTGDHVVLAATERQPGPHGQASARRHHRAARPGREFTAPAAAPSVRRNNLENLDGTTFQITDAADNTTTFEFVNVANARPGGGQRDVGVYFQWASSGPTNNTIDTLRAEIVDAINGYTVIANIDSAHVPVIKNLDGTTFQITDGFNNKATFEFIDAAGTTTLTAGDVPVPFDSSSSTTTLATIRTAMTAAINGAGLACTALALPDGTIALYRPEGGHGCGQDAFCGDDHQSRLAQLHGPGLGGRHHRAARSQRRLQPRHDFLRCGK